MTEAMFPLIFQSLCAHKISSVQHFTWTRLHLELRVWNMFKRHFWSEYLCALQVFLCALVAWPMHARTHAQLRGNIGQKWRRGIRVAAVFCFYVAFPLHHFRCRRRTHCRALRLSLKRRRQSWRSWIDWCQKWSFLERYIPHNANEPIY